MASTLLRRRHARMRFPTTGAASSNVPSESDLAKRQRTEGVLFLSREPMSSRKLAQFADLKDGNEARTIVRHLNEQYDQNGRAFRVEEVGGGFQLMTRPVFSQWLRRFEHIPNTKRLSSPAMETLSVIAYEQPATRADVEAIRGVGCGEVLRQLLEREMVKIAGRSEELGRPYLYATTRQFLQTFGLTDLESLPEIKRSQILLNTDDLEGDTEEESEDFEEFDDGASEDSESDNDFDEDDLEELEDDDWEDDDEEDEDGDEDLDDDGEDDWEEVEEEDDDEESGWEDDYDDLDDGDEDDDSNDGGDE